jgi:Sulfotransferase domain
MLPPKSGQGSGVPADSNPAAARPLDFVVIGAMRAGTTTLWAHLRSHPDLYLPPDKEAPFFSHNERFTRGWEWYLKEYFSSAPEGALWGTSTPHYMRGMPGAPVETIAERMRQRLPDARLVAILRDPIERAMSQHRFATRRGQDTRTFAEAARQLLQPEALTAARNEPTKQNTYVICGEYGRILSAYFRQFPREQILLTLTTQLERRPGETMKEIFRHLGVDDRHVPPGLGDRHNTGGSRTRVSEPDAVELARYFDEYVWPRIPGVAGKEARRAFGFWFRTWNALPDEEEISVEQLEPDLLEQLEAHYEADVTLLAETAQIEIRWPWRSAGMAGEPKIARIEPAGAGAPSD